VHTSANASGQGVLLLAKVAMGVDGPKNSLSRRERRSRREMSIL